MATFTVTQVDHSGENTTTTFNVDDAIAPADRDALKNAVDGVSDGNIWNDVLSIANRASRTLPASNQVQREIKLSLTLEDSVTFKRSTVTIGCASLSALTIPSGSDLVELADGGVMAALVTAVETHATSDAGNPVAVLQARVVGRNT